MKKAGEFLIDSALGEKKYTVPQSQNGDDRIVLSIEEGAVPASLLKDVVSKVKHGKEKSLYQRIDEYVQSLGTPGSKDKAAFFRLMAIMINAGIPLIKSLDTIAEQTPNRRLKTIIAEIARAVEKGGTLSESMARFPEVFDSAQTGMIRSGEAAGQLNRVMKELAVEVEKNSAIIKKVRGAMIYPALIVVVMILVVSGMMIFVVPKIAEIFTQSGKELPSLTQKVIATSNFMTEKWPWLLGGLVGMVIAFGAVRRTRQGRYSTDWFFLRIPVVGKILQKSVLARFSRSLGNLLSSGIPIIQGLQINAKGLGNEVYLRRVMLASEDVSRGIPLGESLRDSFEFPNMLVQMISVGEQTAQLDTIAMKIAEYYEEEVDAAVGGLSKILEPIILIVVGGTVGTIIFSIMLPIMQITQVAGG